MCTPGKSAILFYFRRQDFAHHIRRRIEEMRPTPSKGLNPLKEPIFIPIGLLPSRNLFLATPQLTHATNIVASQRHVESFTESMLILWQQWNSSFVEMKKVSHGRW